MKNIEKYKDEIARLVRQGHALSLAMLLEISPETRKTLKKADLKNVPEFDSAYQSWYSEAVACVRQLLPDRLDDFISYYKPLKPRKDFNAATYTISDYLQGLEATRGVQQVVTR